MMILLLRIVMIASVYFALGRFGIFFAIPSGYASPIFPAAGFAMAIMLQSGSYAWLGILLGSSMLNVSIPWEKGSLDVLNVLIAFGIAIGATLQALLGRWLIVKAVQCNWKTLEKERDIFCTFLYAAPVASLVSATTGILILYSSQVVSEAEFFYAWISWWLGDTFGVLIVLPMSLALLNYRTPPWSTRLTTLVLPMLITLTVVGISYMLVAQWERTQLKLTIQKHGDQLLELLSQRFIAHQEALAALQRLIEVTHEMTYSQFNTFTQITLQENADIFALSFNPYIIHLQRHAFERKMSAKTGIANFEIKERDANATLIRAQDREEYVAVGYIAPLTGNRPAVGYDINSEPIRHEAINRSIQSHKLAATAPIQLVQENQQRVGILLLHPAYTIPDTDNVSLIGFAVAVIKVDEMIDIATRSALIPGLIFEVQDADAPADKAGIYRSQTNVNTADSYFTWQATLPIADRVWNLRLTPTDDYLHRQYQLNALLVAIVGLMLTTLIQLLLLITTGRAAVCQSIVNEQTAELKAKSDILEDRNEQLSALFSLSPDGFISFDRSYQVKYASPAFLQLFGLTLSQVVGLNEADFSALLNDLCRHTTPFCGVAHLRSLMEASSETAQTHIIELLNTTSRILQVGIRVNNSGTGTVSQILYFRDVTHETEVERMKSEFLATAAHELRTPMASVYGYVELLMKQTFDEKTQQELLSIIYKNADIMARLINDLLDLARIEARRDREFIYETKAVSELVHDAVLLYKPPKERASPTMVGAEESFYIRIDVNKTLQALINLLSNAYKYSSQSDRIVISVLSQYIQNHTMCGIEVWDCGIGMTPEQVEKATDRFYRADNSGKVLGAGLGLSIVKEITELQGGKLTFESEMGIGTKVTLWFPRVEK
jgi:signal transduction histidine kinase/CHASE1-domain containing sensor protein